MSDRSFVQWHTEGDVGHIVLNRPDAANAMNAASRFQLAEAVDQAAAAHVGAVVISSKGTQFCAGGDIVEFAERRDDLDVQIAQALDRGLPMIRTLATLPVPVISAIQGPIVGAGIAIALCADFVLASPAMTLRGGYSAVGLSPDLGVSWYLARRVGAARAKYILMTNHSIEAEDCLRWGLIDELRGADDLMPRTCALAAQLARGARQSLSGIKRLCDSALKNDLQTHLLLERDALLDCARSVDGREGVDAFLERRKPRFAGNADS